MGGNWVIMCGQIRDEAAACAKIDVLTRWHKEGLIEGAVVSTWLGELQRYPELEEKVVRSPFSVVEGSQPRLRTPGHTIHQSRSIELALQDVPDDARVLKIRPDLFSPGPGVEASLRAGPQPCDLAGGLPEIFERRVSVIGGFASAPFYLNDIQVLAMKRDMARIFHFDYGMFLRCYNLAPEQFFFAREFLARFPALQRFFEFNPGLIFNNPEGSRARVKAQLDYRDAVRALWLYHRCLLAYFSLDTADHEDASWSETDQQATAQATILDLLCGNVNVAGVRRHAGANTNFIVRAEVFQALQAGSFLHDAHYEAYQEAGHSFRDGLACAAAADNEGTFLAALAEVQPITPIMTERHGAMRVVLSEPDRPSVVGDDDNYRRLEAELNHARRTIEQLSNRLKKAEDA